MEKTFKDFVDEAKGHIREVSIEEVATSAAAMGESSVILVDVREDDEWARGRIPGAIHIGRGVLERDANKILQDKDAEILCYCGGGSRSALAAATLKQMGYTRAASVIGGYGAWKDAGKDVES